MSDRLGRIDQFEAVFKSADKALFRVQEVRFRRVLVLVDGAETDGPLVVSDLRRFLPMIDDGGSLGAEVDWRTLAIGAMDSVDACRSQIDAYDPDLVVVWRNLLDPGSEIVHSLGVLVDELTQYLRPPVLLMPDPKAAVPSAAVKTVMVVTNHLTGEDRLVNKGIRFTPDDGRLILCHVEEADIFDRYMHAIERIPEINTEAAREALRTQLLKEPGDYMGSCIEGMREAGETFAVETVVQFGRRVADFRRIATEENVDLLIFYTKDEAQIAMHGMAYSLAVELRGLALLML